MGEGIGKAVVVAGPTASGKSGLAVSLALALDGEVVSADSMQIYRGMDIGTAKATQAERRGVAHHMLDLRDPGESFSAADYQTLARRAVRDILGREKTPVLAGGTGLYLDSALYNYSYEREVSGGAREVLAGEAGAKDSADLWDELRLADPVSAGYLHPNDGKRIRRALEYFRIHGKPISLNRAALDNRERMFPFIYLGLAMPRDLLYRRIDERVDAMLAAGFAAEAEALRERGLKTDSQAGQAIGYKQMLRCLDGDGSPEQAAEAMKRESRRYAKRQLTWFRRNTDILWIDAIKLAEESAQETLAQALRQGAGEDDACRLRALLKDAGLWWEEG